MEPIQLLGVLFGAVLVLKGLFLMVPKHAKKMGKEMFKRTDNYLMYIAIAWAVISFAILKIVAREVEILTLLVTIIASMILLGCLLLLLVPKHYIEMAKSVLHMKDQRMILLGLVYLAAGAYLLCLVYR